MSYVNCLGIVVVALISVSHVAHVSCLQPLTPGAKDKSVLGDAEVNIVCQMSKVDTILCPTAGAADATCQNISTAVGNCASPSCVAVGVCSFTVNAPVQHPQTSGVAYVTKNVPAGYGVIFPCLTGCLVISVPLSEIGGGNGPAPASNTTTPAGK